VVWFGEMLPEHALREAAAAAESCDAFLSVGTSAVVYPAAGFVEVAARRGAATIEVNPEPTPLTPIVDVALRGAAGECLPRLVDRAFGAG
jgi:NAD-dependent deacetylase